MKIKEGKMEKTEVLHIHMYIFLHIKPTPRYRVHSDDSLDRHQLERKSVDRFE